MPYKFLYIFLDKLNCVEHHVTTVGSLLNLMTPIVPEMTRDRVCDYFRRPNNVNVKALTNWNQVRLGRVRIHPNYKLEEMKSFFAEELVTDAAFSERYIRKVLSSEYDKKTHD